MPRSLKGSRAAGGPLLDERDPGRSPRGYVVDSDATVPPQPLLWCPIPSPSRISVMPDLLAQVEEIMNGRPLFKQEEILF